MYPNPARRHEALLDARTHAMPAAPAHDMLVMSPRPDLTPEFPESYAHPSQGSVRPGSYPARGRIRP